MYLGNSNGTTGFKFLDPHWWLLITIREGKNYNLAFEIHRGSKSHHGNRLFFRVYTTRVVALHV